MRYDFDFSNMPDFVLIKTGEFAVVEDFYKLLKDLLASPKWIKETPKIIDHQYLDLRKMTFDDVKMIQSIVEFHSAKLGGGKCAFVIQSKNKSLAAALTKQSEKETSSLIKFFSDLAEAKKWVLN